MVQLRTLGQSVVKSKSAVVTVFILGNLMVIGLLLFACLVL